MTKQEMQNTIDELNAKLSNQSKMIAELATNGQSNKDLNEQLNHVTEKLDWYRNHSEELEKMLTVIPELETKLETYKEILIQCIKSWSRMLF